MARSLREPRVLDSGDGLAQQCQVEQLTVVEEIAVSGEALDQRPRVGPTVCRNGAGGCEATVGFFNILQKIARPTVANTVAFARRFEVASDTGPCLFKILLRKESPFRSRWRIPTLAESRHVTAPWASDLSLVKGSLRDPGTRPASASDFLAGNWNLRDLMAAFTEYPLKTFFLAVRQLVMGMNFKGCSAGLAGSTLDLEMMENHAFAFIWNGCPVKGANLCGHLCTECGDFR